MIVRKKTVSKRENRETPIVFFDVNCDPATVFIFFYPSLIHTFATGPFSPLNIALCFSFTYLG